MKKIYILLVFILAMISISCEEVVNVPLDTAPPRLVVEAALNWQIGTTGNEQRIKLSTTTSFYSEDIPPVNGAKVTVTNSKNYVFNFVEISNSGVYLCTSFVPELNETYLLTVVTDDQIYTATETLNSVAPITKVEQLDGGFTANQIEIKAFFNDPPEVENYYLYVYNQPNNKVADFFTDTDQFFNGNEFFSNNFSDVLKPGDVVQITHFGISKSYFNFMNIVVSLAGQNGGGPFQTPPATIRGNIVNETNASDFALGYFSISQVDTKLYTIE